MREQTKALDRAVGALLGLACGDAVGTTLEFKAPGSFTPIDDMVGGGPFALRAGEWTDDTSMALCLAESILDTGGMDPADQLRRYLLWWDDGYLSSNGRCFDIGSTTRHQLSRFRDTGDPFDPHPDDDAAANGSLMRLAAVPIRWHADPAEAAEQAAASSRTTHAAARPTDACRLLAAMVAALIGGAPADSVFADGFYEWSDLHPAIDAIARGGWRGKEPPEIRGTGYCVDALEAAVWAVAGAVDFRDAVLRAANLGDDADTTSAIAGQLAGARWGASGIPAAWREKVVAGERITSLAEQLFVAGGGVVDGRWPHDELLHAWWVEPGDLLAGEYPGHADGERVALKLNLLVDAGVRTIVDLTTPADGLEPYAAIMAEIADTRGVGIDHHHFPIPDFGVADGPEYDIIDGLIRHERRCGRGVYVHCWGGVGRTGTVVGCHLAADGDYADGDAVVARLAELRAGTRKAARPCPEAAGQRAVLDRSAHSYFGDPPPDEPTYEDLKAMHIREDGQDWWDRYGEAAIAAAEIVMGPIPRESEYRSDERRRVEHRREGHS